MDRYQNFIQEKAREKRELMGKMFFPRTPILFLDIADKRLYHKYKDLIEALDALTLTTLVAVPTKQEIPEAGAHIRFISKDEREQALRAADFTVMFDTNVEYCWKRGCVPIAPMTSENTVNYNPLKEAGNGFYFAEPNKWKIFAAIVRALETYQFPYDWENLMRQILKI